MSELNLLVVGECGDGKSSLISHFAQGGRKPMVGKSPQGVTKDIVKYDAGQIGGHKVVLWDTPGVGDCDVTVGKLITAIEVAFGTKTVQGVLMCSNIAKGRVTLGAQVCALLAEKGFVGASKWEGFVLVGTQADRCDQEEKDVFKTDVLELLNQKCKGTIDKVATIQLKGNGPDVSELVSQISRLKGDVIKYEAPNAEEMGKAMGELLEIPPAVITKEIIKYRTSAFEKGLKQFASGLTLGLMGWDNDTPVFGAWNTKFDD